MAEDLEEHDWRATSVPAAIRAALDPNPQFACKPLVFELGSTTPSLRPQVKVAAGIVAATISLLASALTLFGAVLERLS